MITILGLREAILRFGGMALKGRAAASVTTEAGAQATIVALKTRAPVRTGALASSIGVVDRDNDIASSTVTVGAQVPYDRYYQQGTSRQPPRPYTEDVANAVDDAVRGIAEAAFRAAIGLG